MTMATDYSDRDVPVAERQMKWVAEMRMVTDLLDQDGVNGQGIDYLFRRYRHVDTDERAAEAGRWVQGLRKLLLDRVARIVAGDNIDLLAVYRDRGDLLDAPDDARDLDGDPAA